MLRKTGKVGLDYIVNKNTVYLRRIKFCDYYILFRYNFSQV